MKCKLCNNPSHGLTPCPPVNTGVKRVLLTDEQLRFLLDAIDFQAKRIMPGSNYNTDLPFNIGAVMRRKLATALNIEQYDAGVDRG